MKTFSYINFTFLEICGSHKTAAQYIVLISPSLKKNKQTLMQK